MADGVLIHQTQNVSATADDEPRDAHSDDGSSQAHATSSAADEPRDAQSDDGSSETPAPALPASFAAVRREIDDAIERLGGEVFPKLNWSAPTDAAWMLGGSPKCVSSEDVLLLLKSSDRVAHDLTEVHRLCTPTSAESSGRTTCSSGWVLAIRKWCELHPSREYRCFSCERRLIAACQRDRFNSYPELLSRDRRAVVRLLSAFGQEQLPAVPELLVWDAYIDRNDKVHLIDLAPFHESTDPILFTWDELRSLASSGASADLSVEGLALMDGPTCQPNGPVAAAGPGPHLSERTSVPTSIAELRVVEDAASMVPSSKIYHGWPRELRELEQEDLHGLISAAKQTAERVGAEGAT